MEAQALPQQAEVHTGTEQPDEDGRQCQQHPHRHDRALVTDAGRNRQADAPNQREQQQRKGHNHKGNRRHQFIGLVAGLWHGDRHQHHQRDNRSHQLQRGITPDQHQSRREVHSQYQQNPANQGQQRREQDRTEHPARVQVKQPGSQDREQPGEDHHPARTA